MISILQIQNLNKFAAFVVLAGGALFLPMSVDARGLELSVTPTLFEMSAVPNQTWRSQVKVINSNPVPLTVYARVMNFAPEGEAGQGKFVPVFEDFTEGTTLAEWIDINSEPVVIEPEKSASIPFLVRVPEDASPGGHFAAILISTQPPKTEGMRVTTSQVVTALFFARVAGDVIEEGSIREFGTEKKFVQGPEASFYVRFENKGNVHIQPQGQIEIFNMWGKERGVIPINSKTHFGNVLPESIRKFEFTWKGEQTLTDIGRYTAVVTLGYGLDSKQFVTSTTYFYVVPVKALVTIMGSIVLGLWFVTWAIRAYVRHMLALSGIDTHGHKATARRSFAREGDVLIEKQPPRLEAPLKSGWLDLKGRLANASVLFDRLQTIGRFVIQYKLFFGSVAVFVLIFVLLFVFVREVGKDQKDYEVTIENADQDVTLTSEDIIYEQKHAVETESRVASSLANIAPSATTANYELKLINAGTKPGAAAALKASLEAADYEVTSISSDFEEVRERTVVIYAPDFAEEALTLSHSVNNALLSADPEAENSIVIYIGNDFDFDE